MLRKSINIIFVFIISIPVLAINFNEYLMGYQPKFSGAIASIAFLVAWSLYGMIMGYHKKISFVKFSTIYWGIVILLYGSHILEIPIISTLSPLAIFCLGPTYGLRYFIPMKLDYPLVIVVVIISWLCGYVGYLTGKFLYKSLSNNNNTTS